MKLEQQYIQAAPRLAAFQQENGGIGSALVIYNESATEGRLARDYVEGVFPRLDIALPGYNVLAISRENPLTPEMVAENVSDETSSGVFVFGGDSTVRVVAKALAGTKHVLYAGSGGNAGNVRLNLWGQNNWNIQEDLQNSTIGQIDPLEINMEEVSIPQIALSIFNIGMLSAGARVLDQDWYRDLPGLRNPRLRNFYERGVLLPAGMAGVRSYNAIIKQDDRLSRKEHLVDFSILNAGIVGKYALWPKVDMLEPGAAISQLNHFHSVPKWTHQVQEGTYPSRPLAQGSELRIIIDRTIPMSYDGDATIIDRGRWLTIGISDLALHVLTNKHVPPKSTEL